jgi:hypothetical protein
MQDSAEDSSKMVAGGLCSSFGVKIRAAGSSGSSKEFELPADSELTNEPGLMGEPPELVTDLPETKK